MFENSKSEARKICSSVRGCEMRYGLETWFRLTNNDGRSAFLNRLPSNDLLESWDLDIVSNFGLYFAGSEKI